MTTRPLALSLMIAVSVLGIPRGTSAQQKTSPDDLITVEVATVGTGMVTRVPVVILHDPVSDKTMPVWIGTAEAEAIARSLFGIQSPRPMTHDLLANLIKAMDGTLEEVIINDTRDGVYYGRLHIRNKEKRLLDVDTRPSDGVALALRTGAPIRVSRKLLEAAPEVEVRPPDADSPDFARALGLTVVSVTDDLRRNFKLPRRDGVIVVESLDEAADAGIRRGDLILEVNGKAPKTAQEFWDGIRATKRGTVTLKYWRNGEEKEVRVTPRKAKGEPSPAVPA